MEPIWKNSCYDNGIALLLLFLLQVVHGGVPDGVVYTDQHRDVRIGDSVELTCRFQGTPLAVYWKKGDDPRTAPNLVSWIPTDNVTGKCEGQRPCEIMEMNENRSLVIKEVSISEQGRYICRVSNYKGVLIHNFTDVSLFSSPVEPFPVIKQCMESSYHNTTQVCSISANLSIILTCFAANFYPDLDLFFLHGSRLIEILRSSLIHNHDGTKNKSISILALASKTPYTCVASDIPGSEGKSAARILVKPSTIQSTTTVGLHFRPTNSEINGDETARKGTVKIAVPIFILLAIVSVGVFLWWKRPLWSRNADCGSICRGRNASARDTQERYPLVEQQKLGGDLSYYELWSLVYGTTRDHMLNLYDVLRKLNIKDVKEGMAAADVYYCLCKWKDRNVNHRPAELLKNVLNTEDWERLCGQRQRTDQRVSQATLEQIIIDIESSNKIQQFLHELFKQQDDGRQLDNVKENGKQLEEATRLLKKWQNGLLTENPNTSMSLALERSGCHLVSMTFFAGMISFLELWELSRRMTGYEDEARAMLESLNLKLEDRLTEEEIYHLLCQWKEENMKSNQGQLLLDGLEKSDFKGAWSEIIGLRRKRDTMIPDQTFEHILWQIKGPLKIGLFLQKITDVNISLDDSKGMRNVVQGAKEYLKEWKDRKTDENPAILLSLALEKTNCCPVDRSFFKVPFELTADINEVEVENCVKKLTSRHIGLMMHSLHIDKDGDAINRMIAENKTTLFKADAMLTEWIREEECSNYEKRMKLNTATAIIGREELKDHFGKDMNPENQIGLANGTTSAACNKVKSTLASNHTCADLFGDAIQSYTQDWKARNPKADLTEYLRVTFGKRQLKDLIIHKHDKTGRKVFLCELHDVAFHLLLADVYPLAETLGISDEKLKTYKVNFTPDHLTQGTIAELIRFSKSNSGNRVKICEALYEAGFHDLAFLLKHGGSQVIQEEIDKEYKTATAFKVGTTLGLEHQNKWLTQGIWKKIETKSGNLKRRELSDEILKAGYKQTSVEVMTGFVSSKRKPKWTN